MGKRGPKPKFNDVACPNAKCSCYGVAGKGNVTSNGTSKIKSGGRVRKFICSSCGIVFCSRKNTVFYGLRTNPEKIALALDLSTKGLSVNKIAEVVKVCPVTVRKWTGKAAGHCEKVNESTLTGVETAKVEMDELWTFVEKKHCPRKTNMKMKVHGSG
jgi:transposase-like protein